MGEELRESLNGLRLMGRRSLLALLGIAASCAAVVALLNIGHNAANESVRSFQGLGTHTLIASFPAQAGTERPAPTRLDARALGAALPMIAHIAPLTLHSTRVAHDGKAMEAVVVGTTIDLAAVLGLRLQQGRFLSGFDRDTTYAVVGADLARKLGRPGDPLRLGDRLSMEGYLFEVVGIMAGLPRNPLFPIAADESVFVPIDGMRRLRPSPEIGNVVAQAQASADLRAAAEALKAYLDGISPGRESEVQIPRHLLDGLARQANTFTHLLAGLGGISLLVGGVGVMSVMLMSVNQRRMEIGIRMALGAKASDIRNLFLMEATALSAAGAVLGAVGGVAVAFAFVRFSGWSFSLALTSVPLGIGSSLAAGLLFGLHPALAAARLQPVVALRDD